MNSIKSRISSGKMTAVAVIAVMLVVGACASGTILKWNQVDTAAMMKSNAGKQKLNTVRFETYGPDAEQLFGYFLYKDGIEVITGEGIPQTRLGKLTIGEVMDDYVNVVKSRQFSGGSNLIVREILRGDYVVGFTATDINMEVNIWDITADKDAKVVLRLVYRDLRKKDGGDKRRDMSPGGR